MKWWRFLLVVLLLAGSVADARGRSGGGFGGSRSRSPSFSRPTTRAPGFTRPRVNRAPSYTTPRSTTYTRRGFGFPTFVFLPFFGFHPFGYGYGYGGGFGLGVLGFLLNLVVVIALIALVVWLVRRFRRR